MVCNFIVLMILKISETWQLMCLYFCGICVHTGVYKHAHKQAFKPKTNTKIAPPNPNVPALWLFILSNLQLYLGMHLLYTSLT